MVKSVLKLMLTALHPAAALTTTVALAVAKYGGLALLLKHALENERRCGSCNRICDCVPLPSGPVGNGSVGNTGEAGPSRAVPAPAFRTVAPEPDDGFGPDYDL